MLFFFCNEKMSKITSILLKLNMKKKIFFKLQVIKVIIVFKEN